MKSTWLVLFALSAGVVLGALLFQLQPVYLAVKPLLMITLLIYFLSASGGYPSWRYYVVAALVFSWAGDLFMMSTDGFIAGLVAFLIAHVFYIIAYHRTGAASGTLKPFDLIKFGLYGGVLIWIIYPGLGGLLIPVLIYAAVLMTMGIWAHKRRGATPPGSFVLVAAGVMLFALSDGMIAVNKFAYPLPAERLLIMSTYITAQYLIVQGLLKHTEIT